MEDERDLRVSEMACGQGHPLALAPYSELPNTDAAEISRSAPTRTSQDATLAGLICNNLQCVSRGKSTGRRERLGNAAICGKMYTRGGHLSTSGCARGAGHPDASWESSLVPRGRTHRTSHAPPFSHFKPRKCFRQKRRSEHLN